VLQYYPVGYPTGKLQPKNEWAIKENTNHLMVATRATTNKYSIFYLCIQRIQRTLIGRIFELIIIKSKIKYIIIFIIINILFLSSSKTEIVSEQGIEMDVGS
tara:strand:- start:140 stop:445 length:306 start_codon:yes stop_codon:yes gene_type:complete